MNRIYGSLGFCQSCKRKKARLHCRVGGLVYCQRCYSRHRYQDPKKRRKQLDAVRRYRARLKKSKR